MHRRCPGNYHRHVERNSILIWTTISQIFLLCMLLFSCKYHEVSNALNFHHQKRNFGISQCDSPPSWRFISHYDQRTRTDTSTKIFTKSSKSSNILTQQYHEKSRSNNTNYFSGLNDSLIGFGIPFFVVLSLAVPQPPRDLSSLSSTSPVEDDEVSSSISTELMSRIEELSIMNNIPIDGMSNAINTVVGELTSSIDDLPLENIIPNEKFISDVEVISNKVIDAAVSTDPVDIFSIALGEGLAGLIGALATYLVGSVLMKNSPEKESITYLPSTPYEAYDGSECEEDSYWGELEESYINTDDFFLAPSSSLVDYDEQSWYSSVIPSKLSERSDMVKGLVTEAVADSDYFLTKSAAKNLFFAIGIAPAVAELASVLLATVPYEFVKLSAKKRQLRIEEDRLMDALLQEDQINKKGLSNEGKSGFWTSFDGGSTSGNIEEEWERAKVIEESTITPGNVNFLDFVELFSDVLKWLEFDVLDSDYSGSLQMNGEILNSGVESAIFGMIIAVSSNLYADITYRYTRFGPETKRLESRTRTFQGWIKKYFREAVSTATLFGVYSAARFPIEKFLSELLSGGIEGCTGSKDFSLCMETYLTANPAMASDEAEIRSFLVAVSSFIDRVRIDLDDGNVGWTELGRSLIVQLYSLLRNIFS